jgi:hypothetical protein
LICAFPADFSDPRSERFNSLLNRRWKPAGNEEEMIDVHCSFVGRGANMTAAFTTAASAQDQDTDQTAARSRAVLLAVEREKKTTETAPPQRSKVEGALYKYDNGAGTPFIFQSWHGLHLAGGSFPAGAGIKAGIGYTHDLGHTRPADDLDRPIPSRSIPLRRMARAGTRRARRVSTFIVSAALRWRCGLARSTTNFPSRTFSGSVRTA